MSFSTYPTPNCVGGNYLDAFDAVMNRGGITYDSAYPYVYTATQCDLTKNVFPLTVTGYYRVVGQQNMINYILGGGTLVVAVDAVAFGSYKSGIFSNCPSPDANHSMQIVGVNVLEGYWIVRNTWGSWWGEQGYMKLALVRTSPMRLLWMHFSCRLSLTSNPNDFMTNINTHSQGTNTCLIENYAWYVTVKRKGPTAMPSRRPRTARPTHKPTIRTA